MATDKALDAAAFAALVNRPYGDLVLLVDDRLRILRAGRQAAQLAQRTPSEIDGMSLIAAFGSAPLDAVAREALTRGRPADGEAELGHPLRRAFQVEAVPIARGGIVLSLHDVTALRRVERVRRDFVANLSHELRTPLSSVKLLAETLSAGVADDPETAREFATRIEREVDHLAQLVDELFDLSMIESGQMQLAIEVVDPDEIIGAVCERIAPVAERREITVRHPEHPAEEGARAAADFARLSQALLNLAHNAVKYSHPGGEIRLGWAAANGRIRFSVADDGIGVPETHQARIFERFYKVDRSRTREEGDDVRLGGSAGLGLAIVRHLAEAHGGAVGVDSREGVGSTFWIEVPRAAEAA